MAIKSAKKKLTTSFPLTSTFSEFDRVFDNFRRDLEQSLFSFSKTNFPSFPKLHETTCDMIDEGNHLLIKTDLPGVTKKEIILNVSDSAIEIHAERKEESEKKKKNYIRKERSQSSYDRIIPLPEKILSGKVKSKLTDGVLEIILPKAKPTPIPKKRQVKIQ